MINVFSSWVEVSAALADRRVIAYPTEAVYGLGCDPFNEHAVEGLFALKQRSSLKGLIVLIHDWDQLTRFVDLRCIPTSRLDAVRATWPGPVTWLFPKGSCVPVWLSGEHDTIALRMSAHPVASRLCCDGPVVSTSANLAGQPPARNVVELQEQFPQGLAGVVAGELGAECQPTSIFDVITGIKLR